MISSPCKNCENKNLPKEICSVNCQILKELQNLQRSVANEFFTPAIDYSGSYQISM